jgi:hypothetical protein
MDINNLIDFIQNIGSEYTIFLTVLFVNLLYTYKNKTLFPIWFIGNNIISKLLIFIISSFLTSLVIYYVIIKLLEFDVKIMEEFKQALVVIPMVMALHKGDLKLILKKIKKML